MLLLQKTALVVAVNLSLFVASAHAAENPSVKAGDDSMAREISTETKARFHNLDKDGNGGISKSEAKANERLKVGFKDSDANRNGLIDQAEYAQFELITGEFTDPRGRGGVINPAQTDTLERGSSVKPK